MRDLGINPYLAHWVLEKMCGEIPSLERVEPLGLEQRVKADNNGQNRIRWTQLPKVRETWGLVELQRWWDKEYAKGKKKDRDAKSVVVKVLGLAVLFRYENVERKV